MSETMGQLNHRRFMNEVEQAGQDVLQLWDAVIPGNDGVIAAIPWRTSALDADFWPQQESPDLALPGRQMVVWLAYRPDDGIIQGMSLWDPAHDARAPLPLSWERSDLDIFHSLTRLQSGGAHLVFRNMPLLQTMHGEISSRALAYAIGLGNFIPVVHFIQAIGIPVQVFSLVETDERIVDGVIKSTRFSRSSFTMASLMWCLGNTQDRPMRKVDPDLQAVLPPLARERRWQAVMAMPCFTRVLIEPAITYGVIDRSQELLPALAAHLGLQISTVRILASASSGMDREMLSAMRQSMDSRTALSLLDAMPRSTLRDMAQGLNADGWRGFAELAVELTQIPHSLLRRIGADLRPEAGAGWDWLNAKGNRWQHARDVTEQMSRELIWPGEAAEDPNNATLEGRAQARGTLGDSLATIALASMGVRRAAHILDEHMEGTLRRAREVQLQGEQGVGEWSVPAEPMIARTGSTMRFLTSSFELAHEGERMDHCVGDYGEACASGRCAVMSIGVRDDAGVWCPSSTVELRRGGEDDAIMVVQHRGRGNEQPPLQDAKLLEEWMEGLLTGETVFDQSALPPSASLDHIQQVLGEHWNTPEAHEARWDRWRRILNVRHGTASEFLRSVTEQASYDPASTDPHHRAMLVLVDLVEDHDQAMGAASKIRDMVQPSRR